MIEVIKPGFYSLIQDAGRFGYQAYGMPVSGALDMDSFRLANWLVGNDLNEAVLEITLTGPVLKFNENTVLGITGANMQPMIDGQSVGMNKTIKVAKGSVLSFGKLISGCRSYLSFKGKLDVLRVMESASTYAYAGIGGVKGRQLQIGDKLFLENLNKHIIIKEVPDELRIHSFRVLPVRVIEGPEFELLEESEQEKLFTKEFRIHINSDRMGYRLEKTKLKPPSIEMLSSGIVKGTIQLPSSGEPILLLSDAQTTGGYPRIANVIQADLSMLAQQKPSDAIRFRKTTLQEAQALFHNKEKSFHKLFEN